MPVHVNCQDTGSSTVLAGLSWVLDAEKTPGAVRRVSRLPSSVDRINGIGGPTGVLFYVCVSLSFGSFELKLEDVPVLPGLPGLLLGNDVYGSGQALIEYSSGVGFDGLPCDGTIRLRSGTTVSEPLPFTHRASTQRHVDISQGTTGSTFTSIAGEAVGAFTGAANEVQEAIETASPVLFAPWNIRVAPFCSQKVKVRTPFVAKAGDRVAILPFTDERAHNLGVVVNCGVQIVDDSGYLTILVTNLNKRSVTIPLLTAIAQFQMDPTIEDTDFEYTTDEILGKINIDPDVTDDDLIHIRHMVARTRRFYSSQIGYAHGYKMDILTPLIDNGTVPPPSFPQRHRSKEESVALKAALDKQLKARLIEPCSSPYGAIPMVIRKADWTPSNPSYRVVLDFRALNNLTVKDTYPLPNIQSNLNSLGDANLFTTADLLMGFHQCELTDSAKLKTAFNTPFGQYCYCRTPMGLTSSPSVFQRLVDSALKDLPVGLALCYVDDVVVPSRGNMETHMSDVTRVFSALVSAGFTARCDKIHVGKKEVPYLGFLCSKSGTRPNPDKTRVLLELTQAQVLKDAASAGRFAGMISVYGNFISNLNLSLAPFFDIKSKGVDIQEVLGSLRIRAAFVHLLHQLVNITALARPDVSKPFYIDVDSATLGGVGAVVTQRVDADDPLSHRPIAFWSHRFSDTEKGWSIRDQECYGLWQSMEHWRHYILGNTVIVRTDHSSLQWLMRTQHHDGSRVAGWALKLQDYELNIEWIAGRENIVADYFSRTFPPLPPLLPQEEPPKVTVSIAVKPNRVSTAGKTSSAMPLDVLDFSDVMADELDAAAPRFTSTFMVLPTPLNLRRTQSRASVVLITQYTDEPLPRVLVERYDDLYSLPAVSVDVESSVSYRKQLELHFTTSYNNSFQLVRALQVASRHRPGRAGRTQFTTQLFVSCIAASSTFDIQCRVADAAGFVSVDRLSTGKEDFDLASMLYHSDDTLAIQYLIGYCRDEPRVRRSLGSGVSCWWRNYRSGVLKCLQFLQARTSTSKLEVTNAFYSQLAEVQTSISTIEDSPSGPALCVSDTDAALAVDRLNARLSKHPGLSIAVDLEGELRARRSCHIALLQVAVDAVDQGESSLVYVFDTHVNCNILRQRGAGSLRYLLEDPHIPKVLHCCHGDAAALGYEYGIKLQHIFDTGLADVLLRRQGPFVLRNLETVLLDWLGASTVQMSFKGTLHHVPYMFEQRPLPLHIFIYAYEDVTFCNLLYRCLSSALRQNGIFELASTLSQQRAPHSTLPRKVMNCADDTQIAVALCDKRGHLICLTDCSGAAFLPSLPLSSCRDNVIKHRSDEAKQIARCVWIAFMGLPSKGGVATAVNSRLRKPVQLGNFLLLVTTVPSCATALSSITSSKASSSHGSSFEAVVYNCSDTPVTNVRADQLSLFQHLHIEASRSQCSSSSERTGGIVDAFVVGIPSPDFEIHLRVKLDLVLTSTAIRARTCITLRARRSSAPPPVSFVEPMTDSSSLSEGFTTFIATGQVLTNNRAALVLHDTSHVLVFHGQGQTGSTDPVVFPAQQIDVAGNALETAIRAFDILAGSALRRGGGSTHAANSLMPVLSRLLTTSLSSQLHSEREGNTEYFACVLPGHSLTEHLSSFYAARRPVNGFRITNTQQKRYAGFLLLPHCNALQRLPSHDALAFSRLLGGLHTPSPSAYTATDASPNDGLYRQLASHLQTLPRLRNSLHEGSDEPPFGADPDFEALFISAAAVNLTRYLPAISSNSWAATTSQNSEDAPAKADEAPAAPKPLRVAVGCGGVGGSNKFEPLSLDEIREEQRDHPATRLLFDYLLEGDASIECSTATGEIIADLNARSKLHFISEDGILRRYATAEGSSPDAERGSRIVLPPSLHNRVFKLYHDKSGHFGVKKCLDNIARRYVWDSNSNMRKQLTAYIKTCEVCQRSKRSHLSAGSFQLREHGEHPFDILMTDIYKVGHLSGSNDSVVSWGCVLTRFIRAEPGDKHLNSEDLAWMLLLVIIRVYGTPRAIRSDHGSVFVSKLLKAVYDLFHIQMEPSAPYHHRTIGFIERWHSTLKALLLGQRIATGDTRWHLYLPLLELTYNTTVSALGHTPFFLVNGRHAVLPVDTLSGTPRATPLPLPEWVAFLHKTLRVSWDAASETLLRNALHGQRRFNLRRDNTLSFTVGQLVLLTKGTVVDNNGHAKSDEYTDGPFEVSAVLPHDNYQLCDTRTRRLLGSPVHVDRLSPFYRPQDLPSSDNLVSKRYPVQCIVGHMVAERRDKLVGDGSPQRYLLYKIRWSNFESTYDSWHSRHYLADIWELVDAYNRSHNLEQHSQTSSSGISSRDDSLRRHRDEPPPPHLHPFRKRPLNATPQAASSPPPPPLPALTVPPPAPAPMPPPSPPSGKPAAHDTSDRFPAGSRVEVRWGDGLWWPCSVIRSYVSRPRRAPAERVIEVNYDAPGYPHYLHGLADSEVRFLRENNDKRSRRSARVLYVSPPLCCPPHVWAQCQLCFLPLESRLEPGFGYCVSPGCTAFLQQLVFCNCTAPSASNHPAATTLMCFPSSPAPSPLTPYRSVHGHRPTES